MARYLRVLVPAGMVGVLLSLLVIANHAGYYAKVGLGPSNLPSLPTAAFCILRRAPPAEIRVGDMVHAVSGRGEVLHRVVSLGAPCLLKGDANTAMETVKRGDILGRLVWWADLATLCWVFILGYIGLAGLLIVMVNVEMRRKMHGSSGG